MIIWIVSNAQGCIRAFESKEEAEGFRNQLSGIGGNNFWINSCTLTLRETT